MFAARKRRVHRHHPLRILQNHSRETASLPVHRVRTDVLDDERGANRRCSDGTAGRRQRSAGGWAARSRSVSEYHRSGGIEPTRPRGGKGHRQVAPLEGKTANTPRLGPVSTSRQRIAELARQALGMAVANAWLPGPAGTRRRVAKLSVEEPDAAEPARPDLWGARVSNDPGLPDPVLMRVKNRRPLADLAGSLRSPRARGAAQRRRARAGLQCRMAGTGPCADRA